MTFERGFTDVERAAGSAIQACNSILLAAKQMQRSAAEGDITKIRRAADRLDATMTAVSQEVANTRSAWPFSPEEEERYLRESFEEELIASAQSAGLQMHRQDERLVAFPSVIRILAGDKAVRVDKTKLTAIRPSRLVGLLKANQTKRPRFPAEKFMETLYRAYVLVAGRDGMGKTVPLTNIYDALTLLPGSDYDRGDFSRDMFLLDRSGITVSRSGARISLPAGLGVKVGKGIFSFVAPDGETVNYSGIRFSEVD